MTLFALDLSQSYEKNGLTTELIKEFQSIIWEYYRSHPRDFEWRKTRNPYHIFISEFMLQQTQTSSVVPKYASFIEKYPNFTDLATASKDDVLKLWRGLGYNRRALWMKEAAEMIVSKFHGILPDDPDVLETLKGIGHATAREMVTFAYNKPSAFIETNIRRVFLYLFFHNKHNINDKDILPLVGKTCDTSNPREWYYALMDYGVYLKKSVKPDPNHRSHHYKKQSKFKGSNRELRGHILRLKIDQPTITIEQIADQLHKPVELIKKIFAKMGEEGFFIKGSDTNIGDSRLN
jgi:A/G-specific adenine glycosylase